MKLSTIAWWGALLAVVMLVGCSSSPEGRIMDEGEDDIVGNRTAGAATYDRLIEGAVTKLLNRQSASTKGLSQVRVAFMGLENKSIEDLGDFHTQIYQLIDTTVNTAQRYRTISNRFVSAALRETRLRVDQLFLPKHRRAFVKTLEADGNPVEFLLFATITSGTTSASSAKQRNYMLTLELVDVETGYNDKESQRIRKEYSK
jgi:hypothetical protein